MKVLRNLTDSLRRFFVIPEATSTDWVRDVVLRGLIGLAASGGLVALFFLSGDVTALAVDVGTLLFMGTIVFLLRAGHVNAAAYFMTGLLCVLTVVVWLTTDRQQPLSAVLNALGCSMLVISILPLRQGVLVAFLINGFIQIEMYLVSVHDTQLFSTLFTYVIDSAVIILAAGLKQWAYARRGRAYAVEVANVSRAERAVFEAELLTQVAQAQADERLRVLRMWGHELRAPLNSIQGYSDIMMLELDEDDPNRPALDSMNRNAHRLTETVTDMLELMSLESGRLVLDKKPVDVRALVQDEIDLLGIQATRKAMRVSLEVADSFPDVVLTDAEQLSHIVGNLIVNAINYTEPNGRVDCRLTATRDVWQLAVEDTGIGISAEDLPRIFEPFVQAGPVGDKRTHQGSGIGLSIVDSGVKLLGGSVEATSIVEKGSTFTLRFPLGETSVETTVAPMLQTV